VLVEAGTRSRIYCCAPQVRPAHVGSRDPDDGIRRLHDRWRGALFEADVARTVKNRAPHVSLLCLAIHSANLFAVLLVADLFEPVDILSAQRFLNGDRRVSRRATKATAMHSVPIIRRKSAQFSVALSRSYGRRSCVNPLTLVRMMICAWQRALSARIAGGWCLSPQGHAGLP
jgi:hypothetical protein